MRRYFSIIVLLTTTLLVSFLLGELLVRSIATTDADGNFYIGELRCYPYHLFTSTFKSRMALYTEPNKGFIRYDPDLGWSPKMRISTAKGLYAFNADGIRTEDSDQVIAKEPAPGVLRVALFGDSFTMGEDLGFKFTWGYYLQENLKKAGIPAEVFNFGVSAYGMDQALLRWRKEGRLFHPQIVIFGLQLENVGRNGNVIRAVYAPIGIPFAKPRFILKEDGELKLINVPTPDLASVSEDLRHFQDVPLSKNEFWYDAPGVREHIFLRSRLIGFLAAWADRAFFKKPMFREDLTALSLKLILKFKEEVEAEGGKFYVVYLPVGKDLQLMGHGLKPVHHALLEALDKEITVVHPEKEILRQIQLTDKRTYMPNHYSYLTSIIIARHMAEHLLEEKRKSP